MKTLKWVSWSKVLAVVLAIAAVVAYYLLVTSLVTVLPVQP